MTKLQFVKTLRDCPANENMKAAGERGLIYDYNVLIDGEHRAIMARNYRGSTYEVNDAERRPVKRRDTHYYAHEVARKADFESEITSLLQEGLIPTLAKMADLRSAEAAEKAFNEAKKAHEARVRCIERAAVDLYEALKAGMLLLEAANGRCTQDTVMILRCRAAIAKAEGRADQEVA